MSERIDTPHKLPSAQSARTLADALRGIPIDDPEHRAVIAEASSCVDMLGRISLLLGLLAPKGSAPGTALEELYRHSAVPGSDPNVVTPEILALGDMLQPHWGDWTPELRAIEGMPAINEPAATD